MSDEYEPWMEKCTTCKHAYQREDDADTWYCDLKNGCEYEDVISIVEVEHETD